jgi:hypothetical protein
MLKDPEIIADLKDRRYDLKPVSWKETQRLAKEVTNRRRMCSSG